MVYGVELEGKRAVVIRRSSILSVSLWPSASLAGKYESSDSDILRHNLAKLAKRRISLVVAYRLLDICNQGLCEEGAVVIDVGMNQMRTTSLVAISLMKSGRNC